jgi:hypothetical protein
MRQGEANETAPPQRRVVVLICVEVISFFLETISHQGRGINDYCHVILSRVLQLYLLNLGRGSKGLLGTVDAFFTPSLLEPTFDEFPYLVGPLDLTLELVHFFLYFGRNFTLTTEIGKFFRITG